MSSPERKSAADILGRFTGVAETFADYEARRVARARGLLRRVLLDLALQEELANELDVMRRGYVPRSEYPQWALRLADVLRNPHGRYSPEVRALVFDCGKLLCGQDDGPDGAEAVTEYLARTEEVPILSDIARDLLPGYSRHDRSVRPGHA